jgi:PAS domain S-box-containing protein
MTSEQQDELKRLRQSDSFLMDVQRTADLGLWEWDISSGSVYWSDQLFNIYGFEPNEIKPTFESYLELVHPEDRARVSDIIKTSLENKTSFSHNERIINTQGSIRHLHTWGHPVKTNNELTGYVGICQDITTSTLLEEQLRHKDEQYKVIFENSEAGIWLIDEKNVTIISNAKMDSILRYEPGEMTGKHIFNFMDEKQIPFAIENIKRRHQGIHEQHEFILRRKDGTNVWTLMSAGPIFDREGKYKGALALVSDLTLRKQAEILSSAQNKVFETLTMGGTLLQALSILICAMEELIEGSVGSVLLLHEDGKRLFTGAAPNLPKAFSEAINGRSIGPSDGSCGTAAFRKETVITSDIENDPIWKDYKNFALSQGLKACWSTPIISQNGKVLGTFAFYFHEIRVPSENELKLAREFTAAAKLSIEHIKIRDNENLQKIHFNLLAKTRAALVETLHYRKVLRKIPALITEDFADWCFVTIPNEEDQLEVIAASAVPERNELIKILKNYKPDMDSFCGIPLAIREGKPIIHEVVTLEDLTKGLKSVDPVYLDLVKKLGYESYVAAPILVRGKVMGGISVFSSRKDRRFDHSDMNVIGQVADSCAMAIDNAILYSESQRSIQAREDFISVASHELRTPLTSLKLRIDLISHMMDKEYLSPEAKSKLRPVVSELQPDIEKFSRLITTLLDFSKLSASKLALKLTECDLSKLIESEVQSLKPDFANNNSPISVTIEKGLFGLCDSTRLRQVIANLLSNALKFGQKKLVEFSASSSKQNLILTVKDHGIGISKIDLDRIFRPFERAVSDMHYGGLGLGLHIVHQIIKAHGGEIRAESSKSETVFTVELPIIKKA